MNAPAGDSKPDVVRIGALCRWLLPSPRSFRVLGGEVACAYNSIER